MQKFKHKNADIWIWKFCLLKIYIDYRELMSTSWLTAEGWFRLMNTTDWKRKITRKFLNSLSYFLLNSLSSLLNSFSSFKFFQTLSDEERWGSIYRRGFGLEILLNLQSWKCLKSITCRDNWGNEVCRGRIFFFSLYYKDKYEYNNILNKTCNYLNMKIYLRRKK